MCSIKNVVLIGRTNVGKSTLFNRLVGGSRALTSPLPGTTRDLLRAEVSWGRQTFTLWDTGGLDVEMKSDIEKNVIAQVDKAIKKADLIIFVTDVTTDLLPRDREVAKRLRKISKPVILVVNKCDAPRKRAQAVAFHELGLEPVIPVSAITGSGTGDLLDEVVDVIASEAKQSQNVMLERSDSIHGFGSYRPAASRMTVGSRLELSCKSFSPGRVGVVWCRNPKILSAESPSRLRQGLNRLSEKVGELWQAALPGPAGGFAEALLTGNERRLGPAVRDDFRRTGLQHVLALSGYNVTVLLVWLGWLLGAGGLKNKWRLIALSLFLFSYAALTGFSPSLVRAALFGAVALWSRGFGMIVRPGRLVWLTGLVTLWFDPLQIWSVSFLLSYTAFAGILCLAPSLEKRWRWGAPTRQSFVGAALAADAFYCLERDAGVVAVSSRLVVCAVAIYF